MEETNKDPNFMAQADVDKKLEEKFKAANQKLEEIQKVTMYYRDFATLHACTLSVIPLSAYAAVEQSMHRGALGHRVFLVSRQGITCAEFENRKMYFS